MKQKIDIILAPPAIQSLLYNDNDSSWPDYLKSNSKLKVEANKRLTLGAQLDYFFKKDVDFLDLEALYSNLSDFIEADSFNQRLILYLPEQLIPEHNQKFNSSAIFRFLTIYLNGWYALLNDYDLRANFLDGDTEQPALVSKAAHLIPILLKKELISFKEIVHLAETSSNDVLRHSVLDTLPVIFDLKLATDNELALLTNSRSSDLRNMSIIIKDNNQQNTKSPKLIIIKNQSDLKDIMATTKELVNKSNELIASKIINRLDRINWKQQKETNSILEKQVIYITNSLANKSLSILDFKKFLFSTDDEIFELIGLCTLKKIALTDLDQAKELSCELKDWLFKIFQKESASLFKALESCLSHWFNLEVISKEYLNRFDLVVKNIETPVSKSAFESEKLTELLELIKRDSELSKYIYPVLLVYGSRIKGYASKNTDIDLAVFVKPGTDICYLPHINERLAKLTKCEEIKGEPFQFWLTDDHEKLSINNSLSYYKLIGNDNCVHVLLGGAWLGEVAIIKKLHTELLTKYLQTNNQNLRQVGLKELERDFLQYRLMHSGYANFFPERKILDTTHSGDVDSSSSFWDEGYRELATKLFIKKIFLPTII